MASNFTVSWGFFYLRQIHLQRRTQNQNANPTCFFELHPTDVRYAIRIQAQLSIINDAIEDYNNICTPHISLQSATPSLALFCIITGYATNVMLNFDNIGDLSDLRQSILASHIYIVPSHQFDIPERIRNRALARMDSFDFVDRPATGSTSFRFGTNGSTSLTMTPEGEGYNRNNRTNLGDDELSQDEYEDEEGNNNNNNTDTNENIDTSEDNDATPRASLRQGRRIINNNSQSKTRKSNIKTYGTQKVQVVIETSDDDEDDDDLVFNDEESTDEDIDNNTNEAFTLDNATESTHQNSSNNNDISGNSGTNDYSSDSSTSTTTGIARYVDQIHFGNDSNNSYSSDNNNSDTERTSVKRRRTEDKGKTPVHR